MAKVKIQGSASGTGILTVTAPNTSTDRTITLPDSTGTILDENSSLPAANITGTLPAIDGSSLTGVASYRPNAKPLIINGDMQVAQRGTSFSHADEYGNGWAVDRFNFNTGAIGVYTSIQESLTSGAAFEAGFKKAARIDCTTAVASPDGADYFDLEYKMEAQDCLAFKKGTSNAETMTVAFWVKSNKTGTSQLNVRDRDNDRMCCGTYAISVADTWEHKVINIAADTTGAFNNDNGIGYSFEWWLGGGSSYTSGTAPTAWEARADADRNANNLAINDNTANDWAITGIQVEVGTYTSATLPPFQFESYGDNLARCQRYYHKMTTALAGQGFGAGFAYNSTVLFTQVFWPVVMRARPTKTLSDLGDFRILYGTGTKTATDSETQVGTYGGRLGWTTSGLSPGDGIFVDANNTFAYIAFDAEL